MQFKALITFVALGAALVAAIPTTTTTPITPPSAPAPIPTIPASQCNTGPIQCCNSTQDAKSPGLSTIFALLGINVQDITGLVGATCSPISVIGVPGNSCSAQPVCCTNNTFNGLIAIGCTPVNLNL